MCSAVGALALGGTVFLTPVMLMKRCSSGWPRLWGDMPRRWILLLEAWRAWARTLGRGVLNGRAGAAAAIWRLALARRRAGREPGRGSPGVLVPGLSPQPRNVSLVEARHRASFRGRGCQGVGMLFEEAQTSWRLWLARLLGISAADHLISGSSMACCAMPWPCWRG
jgi:hypothetical protein